MSRLSTKIDGFLKSLLFLILGCFLSLGLIAACGESSASPTDGDSIDGDTDTSEQPTDGDEDGDQVEDDSAEQSEDGDSEYEEPEGVCTLDPEDTDPDYVSYIGCRKDYEAVAAAPLVSSIPGALSAKTVIDRVDKNNLYFQNSRRYPIHYDFASTHLSGGDFPIVPSLGEFNQTEYYSPDRRFILGALNYYEEPRVWAYEIAPYDTASAEMMELAFRKIKANLWVGDLLMFHPTSDNVSREAAKLPSDIPIITTDELFAGIRYQPLNLAMAMGQLRFFSEEDLETKYLTFRDIAVLEVIPNDISVCSGTITTQFQTPLSHINVLAQNRGTPNMALRDAFNDEELRSFEGKWVKLVVAAEDFSIEEVTKEEADAWWEDNRPPAVSVPEMDLSVTDIRDIESVLEFEELGLEDALAKAIPAFGGKASHYGAFPFITSYPIPYPKAFVVPIYYYHQFMEQNGFNARIETMLDDKDFQDDPAIREQMLETLRDDMKAAPVDADFEEMLIAKLAADFPETRMKFRSSTNCEDLNGFTGAGLYESAVYDPADPEKPLLKAVRKVWASVWRFRAFEEREYRSISHTEVGMAILVNRSFPEEEANGVAITANIFDTEGLEPGHYVNVQLGDTSVVLPPEGTSSDQFVYYYDMPGQPIVYLAHSNMVAEDQTVLTRAQVENLSQALSAIHNFFNPIYGPNSKEHFYGMDVEFKFDQDPEDPEGDIKLVIKQARPYPGRGNGESE